MAQEAQAKENGADQKARLRARKGPRTAGSHVLPAVAAAVPGRPLHLTASFEASFTARSIQQPGLECRAGEIRNG